MATDLSGEQTNGAVASPWSKDVQQILKALEVSEEQGLSGEDVKRRLNEHGPNKLRKKKQTSALTILVNQFKSLIVLLLALAGTLAFIFGHNAEGIAITAVIVVNAAIGYITELRAVRSMEALREMSQLQTTVRRDGSAEKLNASDIVPGDIVLFDAGDMITADLRAVEANKLMVDESTLTGESVPVNKTQDPVDRETPLAERRSMLYKGTAVTRGSGAGVVVATGMQTELGHISRQVEEAEESITPLENRLNALGRKFIWLTLILSAIIAASGLFAGKELILMVETAIALAVAAIPEGLPIVATIALARGMQRMAKRNALINRLAAVETLGSASVICTDKTGTLTENEMTVTQLSTAAGNVELSEENGSRFLSEGEEFTTEQQGAVMNGLRAGVLCSNAELVDENGASGMGDPMEVALLLAGRKAGLERSELLEQYPEAREVAFDSDTRMMATFHEMEDGEYLVAVKGAPEAVLEACDQWQTNGDAETMSDEQREELRQRATDMAADGLRLLALAGKQTGGQEEDPYGGLTLYALVGLVDPPRADIQEALQACHRAGIQVVMVTGDQEPTASYVGRAVGLIRDENDRTLHGSELGETDELSEQERQKVLETSIFARVTPAQKLDLIDIHQNAGSIVAMTGDGVNDAPALTKADIGVAMGKRGTQVARDASDMILKDDAFSSIVHAIEEGRVIYGNIVKFVIFLLSVSLTMILVTFSSSLLPIPLALLPLQILFLNAVVHVFPALALGMGDSRQDVMNHPPRDASEPILTRQRWFWIVGYGLLYTASTLLALWIAHDQLGFERDMAGSVAFLAIAFGQLVHIFNMRDNASSPFINEVTTNRWIWGAVLLCIVINVSALVISPVAQTLRLVMPPAEGWYLALGLAFAPLLVTQTLKSLLGKHG